jgi:hypothetical protein
MKSDTGAAQQEAATHRESVVGLILLPQLASPGTLYTSGCSGEASRVSFGDVREFVPGL